MLIKNISTTFVNYGATTAAEYWQCRGGQVLITFEANGDDDRGILLNAGEGFDIASGKTVYMRATGGRTTWISREVVA